LGSTISDCVEAAVSRFLKNSRLATRPPSTETTVEAVARSREQARFFPQSELAALMSLAQLGVVV